MQRFIVNFFKKFIFENKQIKAYQSSKFLTLNERAQKKKKKEPKIGQNGGELIENQKIAKMKPFLPKHWSVHSLRKKMNYLGFFKTF